MRRGHPLCGSAEAAKRQQCGLGSFQLVSRRQLRRLQPLRCAAEAQAQLLHLDDCSSGLGKLRYNKREQELPEELRGLKIQHGFVIDTKSDKVLNALDAPGSFEIAIKAARGDYEQPAGVENTERAPGVLLSNLMSFPAAYSFQVVGKPDRPEGNTAFVDDVVAVVARHCRVDAAVADVTVQERLGGKWLSIGVSVVVETAQDIQATYEALGRDGRIKMKF